MSTRGIAISRGTPEAHSHPKTQPESPTIDSTERSISPVMMIGVMARAMIEISITSWMENPKFDQVRKKGDSWVPHQTRNARMTTRNTSRRAAADKDPSTRLRAPREWPPAATDAALDAGDGSGCWLAARGS